MGKKRGKAAELTGRSMSSSVGSGATGARRIDERRSAGTEVEDDPMAAMQGLRRCVARWGGRGRHGGASGQVREARGDGERDYGGETVTSSSAMVRERVRETRGE